MSNQNFSLGFISELEVLYQPSLFSNESEKKEKPKNKYLEKRNVVQLIFASQFNSILLFLSNFIRPLCFPTE